MSWLPIETLPPFTDALVCVTHNVPAEENDTRPKTDVEGYVWETLQWVDWHDNDGRWFSFGQLIHIPFPPSHWQPLPAPPVQAIEAGTAETGTGSVHESAVGTAVAPGDGYD